MRAIRSVIHVGSGLLPPQVQFVGELEVLERGDRMRLFEVVVWRNPWHGCPPARDLRARQCHAMKIHALELPAKFGDPGGQLALIRAALAREAADLVVLQECALTGYVS